MTGNPPPAATVSAYFTVKDAAAAIEFYTKAFGAKDLYRLDGPDGRIGHAEIRIGDTLMMLADEHPEFGALSPPTTGGSPVSFHLEVQDADAALERALQAGATLIRPLRAEFYGARSAMVADPFGYKWFVAEQVEQLEPDEIQRRYSRAMEGEEE